MAINLPNPRRTLLIAKRDFLGYIKTWGFWISFFLPFICGAIGFFAATLDLDLTTSRYEAILDDTGQHAVKIEQRFNEQNMATYRVVFDKLSLVMTDNEHDILMERLERNGLEAAQSYLSSVQPEIAARVKIPVPDIIFVAPPASTIEDLQPFLKGEKSFRINGELAALDGVLHLHDNSETGGLSAHYWSPNINSERLPNLAKSYFRDLAANRYLEGAGLSLEGYQDSRNGSIALQSFNPNKKLGADKASQAVTMEDRLPFIVALVLTVFLWLTIFSGSYMLLTSMLEEKLNKLLEMMLSSVQFSEVIIGKLLGVAALTLAAMLPYILLGIGAVIAVFFFSPDPEIVRGLAASFPPKMLFFFGLYLMLGYLFYGSLFIAVGSLAQSMQDAQTLTTPIILILTACIMIVPVAINAPDSEIVRWASYFPLSAPFAAIIRLPSNPPLLELILPALFVFILTIGVIIMSGRIFRYGVLSGAGVESVKTWFARVILRRKTKHAP